MLLSYEKPVYASSALHGFGPERAVDENVQTYWVAGTNGEGERQMIDLENESELRAVQINYVDHDSNVFGKPDALYHQYLLEYSLDGDVWDVLVDKRESRNDVPNDYEQLESPQRARYVRFTNYHVPTPNLAISSCV